MTIQFTSCGSGKSSVSGQFSLTSACSCDAKRLSAISLDSGMFDLNNGRISLNCMAFNTSARCGSDLVVNTFQASSALRYLRVKKVTATLSKLIFSTP